MSHLSVISSSHSLATYPLTTATKVRVYQALVLSVLYTYTAETWTMLSSDTRALESFYMKCHRQTLQVKWTQFVRNDEIMQ